MPHDTRASWQDRPIPALTAQFRTDVQQGLTSSEAAQRLQHYGPNELRKGKTTSPLALLAAQFGNKVLLHSRVVRQAVCAGSAPRSARLCHLPRRRSPTHAYIQSCTSYTPTRRD